MISLPKITEKSLKSYRPLNVVVFRYIRLFFYFEVIIFSLVCEAQEYNYKHYDSRDGLTNSSVFQMLQDKDGFIWFATQAGVSRFDGTHFKNFSTLDGLPANVIVRLFEDSKGRIWMMPFNNAICFFYKGKIHNQQNDSLLRKIWLDDFVRDVVENKGRDLLLTDAKNLYHIDLENHVTEIGHKMAGSGFVSQLSVSESGEFMVRFGYKIFSTDTKNFTHLRDVPPSKAPLETFIARNGIACWMEMSTLCVESFYDRRLSYRQLIGPVNTMYFLSDSILCLNTNRGTFFYHLPEQKIVQRFLPGGNVSHFLADREGGYWFATQNDGVFRLNSPVFKSIAGHTETGQRLGIYSLEKFNNEIWAGCDMGHLLRVKNNTATPVALTVDGEVLGRHYVYGLTAGKNRLAAACGSYVFVKERNGRFRYLTGNASSKEAAWKTDQDLLVASSASLYAMQLDGTKQDAIYDGRTTSVFYRNDSAWFGTFNGLYLMKPDAGIIFLGKDIPLLRVPVGSIRGGPDGTIWIATNGSGLIGLQNDTVFRHFSKHNGLNSEKVRCIGIDSGCVWAATEKELIKIPLQSDPAITRYTYSGELNTDIVTSILVDKDIVYAGTPGGITWFNKKDTLISSICNLKLLGVRLNNNEKELQQRYVLPYRNNNISFDFVAISMKSAGNITYHYRLNGLDSNWKSTTQTSLELISLPPGEYVFEMFAVNKFNVKSSPYNVNIVVKTPFWRSTWFMVSAIALTALIAWFLGTRRNLAVIRKEKLRRLAEEQLGDLEQKALRAQMNPHFIFNSLQSIQGFILDRDAENANKYLGQFASLIRQTLENSFQSSILLADEIKYLNTYLQLEQMRSESKFEYRITTRDGLSATGISIPVMILQPFVENAVRHGVQSVDNKAGLINIHFSLDDKVLVCTIEDNGIGRQLAQLRKITAPVIYRSRGMQLTYERIELINVHSVKKITVEVTDKFNERNEPDGTQVIVRFPIFTTKDTPLS